MSVGAWPLAMRSFTSWLVEAEQAASAGGCKSRRGAPACCQRLDKLKLKQHVHQFDQLTAGSFLASCRSNMNPIPRMNSILSLQALPDEPRGVGALANLQAVPSCAPSMSVWGVWGGARVAPLPPSHACMQRHGPRCGPRSRAAWPCSRCMHLACAPVPVPVGTLLPTRGVTRFGLSGTYGLHTSCCCSTHVDAVPRRPRI